jgi:LysR family hydrogen peroxide-inducible transcriptional activator
MVKALPNIRHLKFFHTLCTEGNYRRAAQKLNITQPALSAAVKELETLFGGPLIDRTHRRRVQPNAAGHMLYQGSSDVIEGYTRLCEEVSRLIDPESWTVRMGVVPTIAPFLLPHLLPRLKEAWPHVDIRIIETTSAQIYAQLDSGDLDYALMAFPFPMAGCHQEPIGHERFMCAVPLDADPFHGTAKIAPAMLAGQKILLLDDGHCLRSHALDACQLKETQELREFQASSLATVINMVAQGHGITLLPHMAAKFGTLPTGIALKEFEKPVPERTLGAAWRAHSPKKTEYLAFTRTIRDVVKTIAL